MARLAKNMKFIKIFFATEMYYFYYFEQSKNKTHDDLLKN